MKLKNEKNLEAIKNTIDEVIAKARNEKSNISDEIQKQIDVSKLIISAIVEELERNKFDVQSANSLPTLLKLYISDTWIAELIFESIQKSLEKKLEKVSEETPLYKKILRAKNNIKDRATVYFEQGIYDDTEDSDLAGKLTYIKFLLIDHTKDTLFKTALLEAKGEVENRIELLKEENATRKLLQDDTEIVHPKNPQFTTTRQVLALRYLLEFTKAKDMKNNAKKGFTHFLIGKDKSTIYKKFDDDSLAYSKEGEDLAFVRQQFENLGLSEILRMIDNDTP